MAWKLWLDDQLADPDTPERHTPEGFIGATNSNDACELVEGYGLPVFMDLDHDLGGSDTAMDFLRALVESYPDGPVPEYRVHSANPVGRKNIESFIDSWRKSLEL